ncbi:division/cell wall cluster transcriptional repressor MraZ [Anaerotignum sp.]|uniref:division/cell wall cluster transcriptional repressor MraZ n=1 Tax=Anaerotignum sp. TaxID=2039241 RepID=UPI0028A83D4E|nr:division/cell wall cluster transcriptional repressor MraZ [Anaerotignum sp.]
MFLGEFQHSIDSKGRLIVPAKFREGLGEHFVVTKGLDNCLFAYPQSEWAIFEEKLKQLPLTSSGARKFVRFFFAGAIECELDNQGRINLPANLREYAGLKKDVVSIGVNNRVEIWNKENWNEYNNEENFISNELAFEMENLGI